MDDKLVKVLNCLDCAGNFIEVDSFLECENCHRQYQIKNRSVFFIEKKDGLEVDNFSEDSIIFKIKNYLKGFPNLFIFFYRLTTPLVGKKAKYILNYFPQPDAIIINLGSGIMTLDNKIFDVDYIAYPNVSVVADALHLPFKDSSVDAVISKSLLEHVLNPEKLIAEIKRILKPGGLLYVLTPFMLGFHSSPNDYYRWTIPGMEELCKDFSRVDVGTAVGPTTALIRIFIEWLAILFSFGSKTLYQFWASALLIPFAPFSWVDVLLGRLPFASNAAGAIYFIGRKNPSSLKDKQLYEASGN